MIDDTDRTVTGVRYRVDAQPQWWNGRAWAATDPDQLIPVPRWVIEATLHEHRRVCSYCDTLSGKPCPEAARTTMLLMALLAVRAESSSNAARD